MIGKKLMAEIHRKLKDAKLTILESTKNREPSIAGGLFWFLPRGKDRSSLAKYEAAASKDYFTIVS